MRLTSRKFSCVLLFSSFAVVPALARSAAPDTDVGRKNGDLSDKLNSTNGVIHPQDDVDPAIKRPAPDAGSTPVIPPPGSPGGAKDAQPK